MRAVLRPVQPELAFFFGLKPWDLERLELGEIVEHLNALQRLRRSYQAGTTARPGR